MLKTKYADKIDTGCPHAYYPRPQFKRDSYLCLNGEWELGYSDSLEYSESVAYGKKILVPFPHESYLSGVAEAVPEGKIMCYRRRVDLPEGFIKSRLLLHFGAVDQECRVYIDGVYVAHNEGGYLPFSADITDCIKSDSFTLTVTVRDMLDKKYPYGKQTKSRGGMWYTPVSGIWQTVWLESVPPGYIEAIKLTPHKNGAMLTVKGGLCKKTVTLSTGEAYSFEGDTLDIKPSGVRPWSPDDPYLYYFTLESGEDKVESYFAIRTVEIAKVGNYNRILLNGKPIIINGLLDQGYYPDGIFLPATEDGYLDDILLAKSLGFNMLRKHIKIEPMIFYHLCDREGIIVLQDMVNNAGYSFIRDTALPTVGIQRLKDKRLNRGSESRRIFKEQMLATAEHLFNTPSILYYTIFNEGWGQFCADSAYTLLKEKDPTRIIDTTSGWFRQSLSDVDSRHIYFKKLKVKSPSAAPVAISEFGGYSYRVEGHLFSDKNYGYRSFGSREEFEAGLIALYENEVIPLMHSGASVFVYTQLSDVEDETNGLVTYDREIVKVNKDNIFKIMEKLRRFFSDQAW